MGSGSWISCSSKPKPPETETKRTQDGNCELMKVNRRTALLLIIVVVVIGGVYAITQWQRSRETAKLLEALWSDDHGVAMKAMTALRERAPAIQAQLTTNMSESNENVRWRSAMLLGSVRTAAARSALQAALKDSSAAVRMNAAMSLGRVGANGAATESLGDLAVSKDEEVPVRTAAVRALTLLRSGAHLPELAVLAGERPPVYPEGEAPEDAPADETVALRQAAVAGVGVLGAVADPELGSQVLNSSRMPAESASEGAMNVLSESASALLEPSPVVRATACTAISDLAVAAADAEVVTKGLRALLDALKDDSDIVRIAAMDAIDLVPVPADMVDQVERAQEAATADDGYWVRQAATNADS